MDNLADFTDMFGALRADGPELSLASELSLFGQFVGAWDLEIDFWPRDESAWSTNGVWLFDWILNGRGIQDVILHTSARGQVGRGTTIRLYDPVAHLWRMAFFGPISRTYVMLTGSRERDSDPRRRSGGQRPAALVVPEHQRKQLPLARSTKASPGTTNKRCAPDGGDPSSVPRPLCTNGGHH
jgi:hypothetical protein